MRLLIALSAAALLAGAAHAQPAPANFNPDLDRDGKVTLAEFKKVGGAGGFMSRLDANKDGKITKAEFQPMIDRAKAMGPEGAARATGMFAMLDTNKDGAISGAERDAATERRFNTADTNHDGWLSKGELLMMRQRMGPRGG